MHLYNNMHKEHKSLGLRSTLWSAARSTSAFHFERNMEKMKKVIFASDLFLDSFVDLFLDLLLDLLNEVEP